MSRMTGSWLSGPAAARDEPEFEGGYRGAQLGLPQSGPGSLAGMGSRVLALTLDWLMSLGLAALFRPLVPVAQSEIYLDSTANLMTLVIWVVIGALTVALFSFTPGQYFVGLRVIRVDGSPRVGIVRALIRGISLAFVVPALFQDIDGRGMHDQATGTAVVRTR